MKNLNTLWENFKNLIYKKYGQESGTMLVHAGVITWITASASQVIAVALNKQIPSDQKKFLIPQEIADGALNVLAFYLITNSLKNISSKLVSTGKWSTKEIRDFVSKKAPDIKLGDLATDLSNRFREDTDFHNCYDNFKGGADMIGATVGSVIACNAIVPVLRNKWGAKKQRESLEAKKSVYSYQSNNNYSIGLKI